MVVRNSRCGVAHRPMARTKLRWNTESLPSSKGPISINCPV
jgi:hypothetical protein